MHEQDCEQLTFFQGDSPVNRSPLPGSAEARRMTVTSSRKCLELSKSCGLLGLLEKTLLESSIWRSTRCYLNWKPKATKQRRLLFQLAVSMPRTAETGSQLFPTITQFDVACGDLKGKEYTGTKHAMKLIQEVQMWPTPSASDCGRTAINPHITKNGTVRHMGKSGKQSYARLDAVAALFPTPQARDFRTGHQERFFDPKRSKNLKDQIGGQLNPTWVEWLMGFPTGWTDLDA